MMDCWYIGFGCRNSLWWTLCVQRAICLLPPSPRHCRSIAPIAFAEAVPVVHSIACQCHSDHTRTPCIILASGHLGIWSSWWSAAPVIQPFREAVSYRGLFYCWLVWYERKTLFPAENLQSFTSKRTGCISILFKYSSSTFQYISRVGLGMCCRHMIQ